MFKHAMAGFRVLRLIKVKKKKKKLDSLCDVTRCIRLDESEDVHLICYLVKSGSDPMDLLVLRLSGGPGCSSSSGLAYEIGELLSHCIALSTALPHPVFENGIGPYYLISPPHSKPVKVIFCDFENSPSQFSRILHVKNQRGNWFKLSEIGA